MPVLFGISLSLTRNFNHKYDKNMDVDKKGRDGVEWFIPLFQVVIFHFILSSLTFSFLLAVSYFIWLFIVLLGF